MKRCLCEARVPLKDFGDYAMRFLCGEDAADGIGDLAGRRKRRVPLSPKHNPHKRC